MVPPATAVTLPEFIAVATAVLLLVHEVLPVVTSLNMVDKPWHTVILPVIFAGGNITVSVYILEQPVPNVYVMLTVPADIPVTTPVDPATDIIAALLLLHAPPVEGSLNVTVRPRHTVAGPVMLDGNAFTVTVIDVLHPVAGIV